MKKFLSLLVFLLISTSYGCSASSNLMQNSKAVRLTRFEGDKITGISVYGGFEIIVTQGSQTKAVVEVNDFLEKNLVFTLTNGILRVGLKDVTSKEWRAFDNNKIARHFKLNVVVSSLDHIELSGGTSAVVAGNYNTANKATISLTGAARLSGLTLSSKSDIDVKCSGAARITDANVSADGKMAFGLSGASRILSSDFISKSNISIGISGASKVERCGFKSLADISVETAGAANMSDCDVEGVIGRIGMSGTSKFVGDATGFEYLSLNVYSSSNFTGYIVSRELKAELTSASKCTVHGNVDNANISTSSASNFIGNELKALKAKVSSSSASNVTIFAIESIEIEASSASTVRYGGNPKVYNVEVSSAASIKKL